MAGPDDPSAKGPRRVELLTAAIQVFARYGWKRASMDQVANAAGLSRQGLYLHFPSKEALFREVVSHVLEQALSKGAAALAGKGPIEERLLSAFHAVYGQYTEDIGQSQHLLELLETSVKLLGDLIHDHEERFREAVAGALVRDGIAASWAPAGLSAHDLAETLDLVAHALKYRVTCQGDFRSPMQKAIQLVTGRAKVKDKQTRPRPGKKSPQK